jgi:hypothetical protein
MRSDPSSRTSDPSVDLVLAEYQSVRQEWLESRSAQQQTFTWTLAAISIIVSAIITSADLRPDRPFLYAVAASLVVIAALSGQAIWFGEISRMERAALYLRRLERELDEAGIRIGQRPALQFERFRGRQGPSGEPWVPKSASLVVGTFAMYCATSLLGIIMLADVAHYTPHVKPSLSVLAAIDAGVLLVAWLTSTLWMARTAVRIWTSSSSQ